MTVLSLVLGRFFPAEKSSFGATLSVITLVAAYALIIAGFVFDWRSVRPMRNAADAEVARMSDKRILQYAATHLDEDAPKKSTRDKKDKGTK